jgi:hypothetical protein
MSLHDGCANAGGGRVEGRAVSSHELRYEDQLFTIRTINGKRCSSARTYCIVAFFRRALEVRGVMVLSGNDDQILAATYDEQLPIV